MCFLRYWPPMFVGHRTIFALVCLRCTTFLYLLSLLRRLFPDNWICRILFPLYVIINLIVVLKVLAFFFVLWAYSSRLCLKEIPLFWLLSRSVVVLPQRPHSLLCLFLNRHFIPCFIIFASISNSKSITEQSSLSFLKPTQ